MSCCLIPASHNGTNAENPSLLHLLALPKLPLNSNRVHRGCSQQAPERSSWQQQCEQQCTISQQEGKATPRTTANQRGQIQYVYLEHSPAKDELIVSQKSVIEVGKNHLQPSKVEGRRGKSKDLRSQQKSEFERPSKYITNSLR